MNNGEGVGLDKFILLPTPVRTCSVIRMNITVIMHNSFLGLFVYDLKKKFTCSK